MRELKQKRLKVGDEARIKLSYSEVCMHMGVAGQVRRVRIVSEGMAQILNDDGTPFSAPVTHGEAGIYRDHEGLYCNPVE